MPMTLNCLKLWNALAENGNLLLISGSILPIIIPCCAGFVAGRISRGQHDEFTFDEYWLLFRCCAVSALARFLYDLCRNLPPVATFALSGTNLALSAATGRDVRQYGTSVQE